MFWRKLRLVSQVGSLLCKNELKMLFMAKAKSTCYSWLLTACFVEELENVTDVTDNDGC